MLERTLDSQKTRHSSCSWVSVVLGCHREMEEREMECVAELWKVERDVEDRVQTRTGANET